MRFETSARTLILAAAALSGCGSDPYEYAIVRGRVTTCEGKPAVGGTVVFRPVDDPQATGRPQGNPGREARGKVAEDGTFELMTSVGETPIEGTVTGPHRVEFLMPPTERPTLSPLEREWLSPEEIKKWEAEYATYPVYDPLPCSAKITPANVTVAPGANEFEFTLPPAR